MVSPNLDQSPFVAKRHGATPADDVADIFCLVMTEQERSLARRKRCHSHL